MRRSSRLYDCNSDKNGAAWGYTQFGSSNLPRIENGAVTLLSPPVRPGATYYVGVYAKLTSDYTLASSIGTGRVALTGAADWTNDDIDVQLAAGEKVTYRIDVPADAARWRHDSVLPAGVHAYLQVADLPGTSSGDWAKVDGVGQPCCFQGQFCLPVRPICRQALGAQGPYEVRLLDPNLLAAHRHLPRRRRLRRQRSRRAHRDRRAELRRRALARARTLRGQRWLQRRRSVGRRGDGGDGADRSTPTQGLGRQPEAIRPEPAPRRVGPVRAEPPLTGSTGVSPGHATANRNT